MEKIQADIVNNSTDKELLCESIINDIENEFTIICSEQSIDADELKNSGEKNGKQFTYILMTIGKRLFKGTNKLKDMTKNINGFYNTYDIELIDLLLDYYFLLCSLYNKAITKSDFTYMLGLSRHLFDKRDSIDEILNGKHCDLNKKIADFSKEEYVKTFKNSNQAIKNITIGNVEYGWSDNSKQSQNITLSISSDGLKQSLLELKKD